MYRYALLVDKAYVETMTYPLLTKPLTKPQKQNELSRYAKKIGHAHTGGMELIQVNKRYTDMKEYQRVSRKHL